MDKKIAGLLGALGSLAVTAPVQAAPSVSPQAVLAAASYADLLRPIPNAAATLQALDAQAEPEAAVEAVQYYERRGRRDHHHHRYVRRHHHHHHHRYDRR